MSKSSMKEGRLRVCILTFMFLPFLGGAEMQALKQAREFQARGHDVTLITLRHGRDWKREETLDGIKIIRVGGIYKRNGILWIGKWGRPAIDLAMLWQLWKRRDQFDVYHSMQMSCISTVAAFICQLTHKPIVISVQSAGPNEEQKKRIQQNGLSLMADTLTTDTDYLRVNAKDWIQGDIENLSTNVAGGRMFVRFLKKSRTYFQVLSIRSFNYLVRNGFRPEQIVRIPNGIDTALYHPASSPPDPTKPERDILCVARMEYPKGVDVLVHAWARMMKEPAEWRSHLKPRLRLVGIGLFKPQIERIARELGIMDSVEFLGLRHDIPDLLRQSWGFVLPSRWEGMPNALLEAMACGLPCVATRVSGSEDLINDGVNGLLVSPEQPAEMAKALRRLIEESDLARRMGEQARATIVNEYQIAFVADRCLQLYHRLLSQQEPASSLTLEKEEKV